MFVGKNDLGFCGWWAPKDSSARSGKWEGRTVLLWYLRCLYGKRTGEARSETEGIERAPRDNEVYVLRVLL